MDEHIKALMKGAVDMHIHTDPSFMKRTDDAIGVATKASAAGMRAVCFKDHHFSTVQEAWLANVFCPKRETPFTAFGSFALNNSNGGFNIDAVETAIRFGAKQIFLPTISAGNQHPMEHADHQGADVGSFIPVKCKPIPEHDLSIYANGVDGEIHPKLQEIMELVRDSDVILGTGHLCYNDAYNAVKCAAKIGCKKILLTHFDTLRVRLNEKNENRSPEEMAAVQSAGDCFVEYAIATQLYGQRASDGTSYHTVPAELRAGCLKRFGPDRVVISTDSGSCLYGLIDEMYPLAIEELVSYGWSDEDIHTMTSINACGLLGIDPDVESETDSVVPFEKIDL